MSLVVERPFKAAQLLKSANLDSGRHADNGK
jgi:hypothetical protein